jgi:hypothetical protein
VLISGVDIDQAFGNPDRKQAVAVIDETVGSSDGLHILSGTSPGALAKEAGLMAGEWSLKDYATRLANRPLLLTTSDDGFAAGSDALADAVEGCADNRLTRRHFATDHSYSDCRVSLQVEVLRWLANIDPPAGGEAHTHAR